jgi:hypothetical protein
MTLPSSGPLSLNQINNEFGRGRNLNAYRGTQWFTDDGSSGTFTSSNLGFNQFYGKRPDAPWRYGTGSSIFSPQSPTSALVFSYVNSGQPFAYFEIWLVYNSVGLPVNVRIVADYLDDVGNWAAVAPVSGEYWYPTPRTNGFELRQQGPGGGLVTLNTWYVTSTT